MNHMYIRRLMGQKSKIEDSYLKLSEEDLLEGDFTTYWLHRRDRSAHHKRRKQTPA